MVQRLGIGAATDDGGALGQGDEGCRGPHPIRRLQTLATRPGTGDGGCEPETADSEHVDGEDQRLQLIAEHAG